MKNIRLITGVLVDLKDFQEVYNITSNQVGIHFNLSEFPEEFVFSEQLIRLVDVARRIYGKPIKINSSFRTQNKQDELRKEGYRAATFSPHCVGMAWDLDTKTVSETLELVNALKLAATYLNYQIRLGYKEYMKDYMTFVHVDVCPMFYGNGMALNDVQHPFQWETQMEW